MRVTASVGDTIVADSTNTILIEGNHYFPPEDVRQELFEDSDLHTHCPWKGEASYKTLIVGDQQFKDVAWYYPEPMEGALKRVGKDFSGWFAFYTNRGLEIKEENE